MVRIISAGVGGGSPDELQGAVYEAIASGAMAATPDASASTKGKVALAGDLGGTAAAPTVPALLTKVDAQQLPTKMAAVAQGDNEFTAAQRAAYAPRGDLSGFRVFLPERHGAVGDGIADDSAAIQAAIQEATDAKGGCVYLGRDTYRVAAGLTVKSSAVTIKGAGRLATTLLQDGPLGTLLDFRGTIPSAASPTTILTADAGWSNSSTVVSQTAQVVSTAGLAVGDVVVVGDTATIPWTSDIWGTRMAGEMQRVKALTPTQVTFHGRLRGTYTVARSARLYKVTALADVGVSGLTIRNGNPLTTTTKLLSFFACRDVTVSDVALIDGDTVGLDLAYVYGFDVNGLVVRDLADDGAAGRFGYGVNLGPCEAGTIAHSRFYGGRHAVTTNGQDDHHGYAMNVVVDNCIATGSSNAAFDTHPGSDITFTGCSAGQTGSSAFNIRSRARLVDCEASYANIGVYIQGAASRGVEVVNLTTRFTAGAAIAFWGDAASGWPTDTRVISPSISDTNGAAIVVGGPVDGLSLIKPTIRRAGNSTTALSAAIHVSDGANPTRVVISGAEVEQANSAVLIGSGVPDVRVTGTRSRNLWGSSPAVLKGSGLAAPSVVLNDNLDLDLDGNLDELMPATSSGSYVYTASPAASSTSAGLGVGQMRVVPWLIRRRTTINQLVVDVTAPAEAGGKLRPGVYRDSGAGLPGALVVDGGQVAADSVGVAVASFASTVLKPGLYWVGVAVQDVVTTQPTVRTVANWHPPVQVGAGTSPSGLAGGVLVGVQASGFTTALPATFPGVTAATGFAARVAVRVA